MDPITTPLLRRTEETLLKMEEEEQDLGTPPTTNNTNNNNKEATIANQPRTTRLQKEIINTKESTIDILKEVQMIPLHPLIPILLFLKWTMTCCFHSRQRLRLLLLLLLLRRLLRLL